MKKAALVVCWLVPVAVAIGCVVVSEKPADSAPPPPPPNMTPTDPAVDAGPATPAPAATRTPEGRPRLRSNRPVGGFGVDGGSVDGGGAPTTVSDAGLPDGFSFPFDASLDALPR